jgi:hypothetical protein
MNDSNQTTTQTTTQAQSYFEHHLYLIHDENNIANLTPALDPDFKPNYISLIYESEKQAWAEALEKQYKIAQIEVFMLALPPTTSIEIMRDIVLDHVVTFEHSWALNIAGGSRPLCAVAHEIFCQLDYAIFYTDTVKDRIVWIHIPQQAPLPDSFHLANHVKLHAFFSSYLGHVLQIEKLAEISQDQLKLFHELTQRVTLYQSALKTLNYFAGTAESTLRSNSIEAHQLKDESIHWLLNRFEQANLLKIERNLHQRQARLQFVDETSRFMVNGGWLENYVQHILTKVKKKRGSIHEIGRSVEIEWNVQNQIVKNEIDLAFLANNRLYLIECKTKSFKDRNAVNEVIYKLDTLQHMLGGIKCAAMLISYHDIPYAQQRRAAALSIDLCAGKDLHRLEETLLQWIPESNV